MAKFSGKRPHTGAEVHLLRPGFSHPRPSPSRPDNFGNIRLWEAIDTAGLHFYPESWTRTESEATAEELERECIKERTRRHRRASCAWVYCHLSRADRDRLKADLRNWRETAQRVEDVVRIQGMMTDLGSQTPLPTHPSDLYSDKLSPSLDAGLEAFLVRAAERAERANQARRAVIARWSLVRDWLSGRLFNGAIPAFLDRPMNGEQVGAVPTSFWLRREIKCFQFDARPYAVQLSALDAALWQEKRKPAEQPPAQGTAGVPDIKNWIASFLKRHIAEAGDLDAVGERDDAWKKAQAHFATRNKKCPNSRFREVWKTAHAELKIPERKRGRPSTKRKTL